MSSMFVEMLIDMGFPKEKAEKAVSVTGNQGVEPAMEWLLAHSESMDESETNTTAAGDQHTENTSASTSTEDPTTTPKSIKCDECGKLFTTQVEIEFHAAKSGHSKFSESTDEKKAMTEEEKLEQLKKLEEKMKQKRKEREEKEKLEELEREKIRIRSGKEIIAAKKKLEDEEIKKIVDQRKREKMEDKAARQRVKDQIEQDKLARKEKFGGGSPVTSAPPTSKPVAKITPQKDYSETRLQVRLTDGSVLTQTFGVKEPLAAVRVYIEQNRKDGTGPFSLMTTFPRKVFSNDEYDTPLDVLGLVPSAVIILSKSV